MAHRHTNLAGVALIKRYEGLRLRAYLDAVGVPTIGYGHTHGVTAEDVRAGRRITLAQAEAYLQHDLLWAEDWVASHVTVVINENQFSALVSWVYNVGPAAAAGSTLLRRLNQQQYSRVPAELARWVRAGGRVLPGLVARREAEAMLWRAPVGRHAELAAPEVARIVEADGPDVDGDEMGVA